jgi:hypothetical protein
VRDIPHRLDHVADFVLQQLARFRRLEIDMSGDDALEAGVLG